MKAILVDIDHTLSDAAWRDTMERGGKDGWDEYYKAGKLPEGIRATPPVEYGMMGTYMPSL